MDEKRILTQKRQQELILINQVLAVLVVLLSFSTGYLLAIRHSWISPSVEKVVSYRDQTIDTNDPFLVKEASSSALTVLLKQARYERVIQPHVILKQDVMAIVWAAQGKITDWGERTVPSYKSAFPLEILLYARNVEGITQGWYQFRAKTQQLIALEKANQIPALPTETNPGLLSAPAIIILTAATADLKQPMVWNEAGGIAQNILLMTRERQLITYLIPGGDQKPYLWIMPFGHEKVVDISVKEDK